MLLSGHLGNLLLMLVKVWWFVLLRLYLLYCFVFPAIDWPFSDGKFSLPCPECIPHCAISLLGLAPGFLWPCRQYKWYSQWLNELIKDNIGFLLINLFCHDFLLLLFFSFLISLLYYPMCVPVWQWLLMLLSTVPITWCVYVSLQNLTGFSAHFQTVLPCGNLIIWTCPKLIFISIVSVLWPLHDFWIRNMQWNFSPSIVHYSITREVHVLEAVY